MTKLEALTTIIKQSNLNCDGIDCANCPFNILEGKPYSCCLILDDGLDKVKPIEMAIVDAMNETKEEEGIPKKGEMWKRIGADDCTAVTVLNVYSVLDKQHVKYAATHVAVTVSLESFLKEYEKVKEPAKPSHTTPEHYKLDPEPIDVIKGWDLGFCLGNVIKYLARAGHKAGESRDKDLHKAMEYLRMELEDQANAKESTAARRCC